MNSFQIEVDETETEVKLALDRIIVMVESNLSLEELFRLVGVQQDHVHQPRKCICRSSIDNKKVQKLLQYLQKEDFEISNK
jgi:hypothetical protein